MKRMLLVLGVFVVLLPACDMGLDDGSDLVGTWKAVTFGLFEHTFNADGTGVTRTSESADFTWRILVVGSGYKLVSLSYINGENASYEYYFDPGKTILHMHNTGGGYLWMNYLPVDE